MFPRGMGGIRRSQSGTVLQRVDTDAPGGNKMVVEKMAKERRRDKLGVF
tara:strand:- start:267 stop:413 length:147 start_codon:yes stop_codon:yes gene_type:complete